MKELHLLAYALKSSAVPQLGAWCPWCQRVHVHGDPGGERRAHRGGGDHCFGHPFGNGYALVRAGRIDLQSRIPRLTTEETLALSAVLERAFTTDSKI